MDETQGCVAAETTRWDRLRWQINRKTWPYTSKVAWWIYRLSHPFEVPYRGQYPRWVWSFMNGLACGSWTHVCGHGPKWSFHMAMIYWNPKPQKLMATSQTVNRHFVGDLLAEPKDLTEND